MRAFALERRRRCSIICIAGEMCIRCKKYKCATAGAFNEARCARDGSDCPRSWKEDEKLCVAVTCAATGCWMLIACCCDANANKPGAACTLNKRDTALSFLFGSKTHRMTSIYDVFLYPLYFNDCRCRSTRKYLHIFAHVNSSELD